MEEYAQVILSRFPQGSQFFTNTRHGGDLTDFHERVTSCWPMTRYAWDFGLVAVPEKKSVSSGRSTQAEQLRGRAP
ncbi:hypothetical protein [Streptomyces flaveolus]|uniref:hypothetical protein n=1 Tax=Streptomyces flaveolus TaxID=67297 RepID=UPI0033DECFB6